MQRRRSYLQHRQRSPLCGCSHRARHTHQHHAAARAPCGTARALFCSVADCTLRTLRYQYHAPGSTARALFCSVAGRYHATTRVARQCRRLRIASRCGPCHLKIVAQPARCCRRRSDRYLIWGPVAGIARHQRTNASKRPIQSLNRIDHEALDRLPSMASTRRPTSNVQGSTNGACTTRVAIAATG